ncbi:MAG: carbamoyltransferase HypF [Acidobacteriia bacterium]|nr:carbamoyltransferase HypF [Terriglobia bacterium]
MIQRIQIVIRGAVQGVGFRPFVYRLSRALRLSGWVSNSPQGVFIEVEGEKQVLDEFLLRLERERPLRASIQSLEYSLLDPVGFEDFEIRESGLAGKLSALVLPDIATCPECLQDIFDPANRRYLYPFTNCTNCGPRFTIIESLPYDRANTAMKQFVMCGACRREYEDPMDRRFHAQPNACPQCGPHLELWDETGAPISRNHEALSRAVEALHSGGIVAIKGLGGFHLMVDARDEAAVLRLRDRKHRDEKPLALMFPSLESAKSVCEVSALEERLLLSPESPIVLLRRKVLPPHSELRTPNSAVAPSVAPHNPFLGIMLPYTPLHHLLMRGIQFPAVATSGNLSDEPICTDEVEAARRLAGIADLFLVHNRPIVRHVDDSVVRLILGRELVVRRARGYAPLPVSVGGPAGEPLLAVGAHLKNTVAITAGDGNVFVSQHIGDLETNESFEAFRKVIDDFRGIYKISPKHLVCDLHPDYLSTKYAQAGAIPTLSVQHHYAHVAACMAENELEGSLLGVSWDGTGFGSDGTIWGGEFLLTDASSFRRFASFRQFRLPGSAVAIREPRRAAIGLLHEVYGPEVFQQTELHPVKSFTESERSLLRQMLLQGVNSPLTSSAGRLFDAVASIVGIRQKVRFEGQAAMELEFTIGDESTEERYPFHILESDQGGPPPDPTAQQTQPQFVIDWSPLVEGVLGDLAHVGAATIALKFHNSLAEMIVEIARRSGEGRILLTGGCFQNKYLTERTVRRLEASGLRPYWHQRIPPNDGGISLGQIVAATRLLRKEI